MSQECKELIILVVEDEVKARESMINILSERFSKVIGAQNGDEGLKKFKKFKPDLVITDIAMPIMDGLDMAREIKEIQMMSQLLFLVRIQRKRDFCVLLILV